MTFSFHQGGVVMSRQITLTKSPNIHPYAQIPSTCFLIFTSCSLFTVYPNCIM